MKNLIRKILKESIDNRKLNYGLSLIEKGRVEKPYDKGLGLLGFDYDEIKEILTVYLKNIKSPYFKKLSKYVYSEDVMKSILSSIIKEPITISLNNRTIKNEEGQIIYEESLGYWFTYGYNEKGFRNYEEKSDGHWIRKEYDDKGNVIYYENSKGNWERREYDKNNKLIYSENSNDGVIIDKR